MNVASIGNFLGPDTPIIVLAIILLFGAKRLPELARGAGQAIRDFTKAKDGKFDEPERVADAPAAPTKHIS